MAGGGRRSIEKLIERPASPCNRKGSSEKESWSEVEDRIHGWWSKTIHRGIQRSRALVDATQKIPAKDEAPFYELRFVRRTIVRSRPRCQGSAMNAPLRGAPLTPLPARGWECVQKDAGQRRRPYTWANMCAWPVGSRNGCPGACRKAKKFLRLQRAVRRAVRRDFQYTHGPRR